LARSEEQLEVSMKGFDYRLAHIRHMELINNRNAEESTYSGWKNDHPVTIGILYRSTS
jgi:hypothetical protein